MFTSPEFQMPRDRYRFLNDPNGVEYRSARFILLELNDYKLRELKRALKDTALTQEQKDAMEAERQRYVNESAALLTEVAQESPRPTEAFYILKEAKGLRFTPDAETMGLYSGIPLDTKSDAYSILSMYALQNTFEKIFYDPQVTRCSPDRERQILALKKQIDRQSRSFKLNVDDLDVPYHDILKDGAFESALRQDIKELEEDFKKSRESGEYYKRERFTFERTRKHTIDNRVKLASDVFEKAYTNLRYAAVMKPDSGENYTKTEYTNFKKRKSNLGVLFGEREYFEHKEKYDEMADKAREARYQRIGGLLEPDVTRLAQRKSGVVEGEQAKGHKCAKPKGEIHPDENEPENTINKIADSHVEALLRTLTEKLYTGISERDCTAIVATLHPDLFIPDYIAHSMKEMHEKLGLPEPTRHNNGLADAQKPAGHSGLSALQAAANNPLPEPALNNNRAAQGGAQNPQNQPSGRIRRGLSALPDAANNRLPEPTLNNNRAAQADAQNPQNQPADQHVGLPFLYAQAQQPWSQLRNYPEYSPHNLAGQPRPQRPQRGAERNPQGDAGRGFERE